MLRFAHICEAIAATRKKLEKTALVADYLVSLPLDEATIAAIFLSGQPFPVHEETTLQVGGALLWELIAGLSGKSQQDLTQIYRQHGDAGAVAAAVLAEKPDSKLSLTELQRTFREIASTRSAAAKSHILRNLLLRAQPLEAKYIVKIITGDLRIGLKESLVEEAIASAFLAPLDDVKRANMLLGDIGETLRLAAAKRLADARLRLFHPIDFMLASPVETSVEALDYFQHVAVEDKYDGIRAQAHIGRVWSAPSPATGEVRLFSRTRDDITESFPELPPVLAGLPSDAILDGEIVAWSGRASLPNPCHPERSAREAINQARVEGPSAAIACGEGRALPFTTLQQRLGRKNVSAKLMREVPVAYLVFDVLYANGELLLDRPLQERAKVLSELLAAPRRPVIVSTQSQSSLDFGNSDEDFGHADDDSLATVVRAPTAEAHSPADLEALFAAARARGNEGLMIKDLDSPYTPGRRGKSWLKMKRELATLDVVVTAVEYGHGKRIGVLSDYTFAVWDGDRLVNIGKAYSGLTDAEIAEMTEWFLAHKVSEEGLRLEVEPKMVIEVAFNNMMKSSRHESGYALRFPRIVRLRPDKSAKDADTMDTVKEIFSRQHQA